MSLFNRLTSNFQRRICLLLLVVCASVFVVLPATVLADDTPTLTIGQTCKLDRPSIFLIPTWWEYIKDGEKDGLGGCDPQVAFPSGILLIGLAVVDILLHIAGLAAVVFIMIAGVTFVTATGNPDKTRAARSRIINTFIGLGIVLVATAVVTFIGDTIK